MDLQDPSAMSISNAVNGAAQQLQQQNGMPNFLVDEIKQVVSKAVQNLTNQRLMN